MANKKKEYFTFYFYGKGRQIAEGKARRKGRKLIGYPRRGDAGITPTKKGWKLTGWRFK